MHISFSLSWCTSLHVPQVSCVIAPNGNLGSASTQILDVTVLVCARGVCFVKVSDAGDVLLRALDRQSARHPNCVASGLLDIVSLLHAALNP